MKIIQMLAASFLLVISTATSAATTSIVYDVAGDWSDLLNPNGAWSYEVNGELAISGIRTGDSFGIAPPLWGPGGNSFVGWSQSNGTEVFVHNWSSGQVFGHSPSSSGSIGIVWTSPFDGVVSIAGTILAGRAIGRSNDWVLTLAGVDGFSIGGTLDDTNQSEFFATTADVNAGDVLRIEVSTSGLGDYVFFENYTIELKPVPLPAAAWLFMGAVFSLLGFARHSHA